jgi:hypothetical protein
MAEFSTKGAEKTYGANDIGPDVYCSTSNELSSYVGLQNGQTDPIETKFTTSTIYLVKYDAYGNNLDWTMVVAELYNLISLNNLGDYCIEIISQQDAFDLMGSKGFQSQDAILGIRDGESIKEWGLPGLSIMDSGSGGASWKESFVSPTVVTEKAKLLRKTGINVSKEKLFAIITLHEAMHQDIQRMHWSVMGQRIQNSFPSIMPDAFGHNNSSPNLMMDGKNWIDYALANPKQFNKLLKLQPDTYRYVKAYKFGTYLGLKSTAEWRNILDLIDVFIKK